MIVARAVGGDGDRRELRALGDVEFGEDVRHVSFDGFGAHEEALSNLAVGQPFANQPGNM